MNKLIAAYRALPTLKNAERLRAYDRKHPMATCFLDAVEAALVAEAIRHANDVDILANVLHP